MVNAAITSQPARAAERALAVSYSPAGATEAVAALLALDDALAMILRTTREPLVGQMRLTWWHGALVALDTAPPPAEPVLGALAAHVLPRGVTGGELAGLVDGWEQLLAEPPDIARHAEDRGSGLFAALARVSGAPDDAARIAAAGRGWALADLAANLSDPAQVRQAGVMAARALQAAGGRWSRAARMLGAMTWLAGDDLRGRAPGSPRRVARLAWIRLTGL